MQQNALRKIKFANRMEMVQTLNRFVMHGSAEEQAIEQRADPQA